MTTINKNKFNLNATSAACPPTLYINSFIRMFFQIQLVLDIFAKQVANLFIVDLKVRSMDEIFHAYGHLNGLKDMIERSDKQTW